MKGHGSERAYEQLAHSLQTFGGSGYLQDYPVEQYIRDAKIDTLYEGTTTIQGLDLFFRKIVRDNGQALAKLAAAVQDTAKGGADDGLDRERELLGTALEDTQAIIARMVDDLMAAAEDRPHLYKVGLNGTRLLHVLGELVVGWLLVRQAEVAAAALDRGATDRDRAFYAGKIAAARLFTSTVFPELTARRAVAEGVDLDVMQLEADAF